MRYVVQTQTKAGVDEVSNIAQSEHSRFRYSDGDYAVDVTVTSGQLDQIAQLSDVKQVTENDDVLLEGGVSDPGEWPDENSENGDDGAVEAGTSLLLVAALGYAAWRATR